MSEIEAEIKIDRDRIKPFFQSVIYDKKIFDKSIFLEELKKLFGKINNKLANPKYLLHEVSEISDDRITMVIQRKSKPTWYRDDDKSDNDIFDIENILLIIYVTKKYLFFHSSDESIFNMIDTKLLKIKGKNLTKITPSIIEKIFKGKDIEYKSLGIANLFNLGGSAPSSKAYFGRDTKNSLTTSFDSGFNMSYFLGNEIKTNAEDRTIGCSTKKSKVWTGWENDIDSFVKTCKEIEKSIEVKNTVKDNDKNRISKILCKTKEKYDLDVNNLMLFTMDYYIPNSGVVILSNKDEDSFNWIVIVNDKKELEFHESTNYSDDNAKNSLLFTLRTKVVKGEFEFSYKGRSKDKEFTIHIENEYKQSNQKPRKIDIVEYLNKQNDFTMLFDKGIAYRNNFAWENNKFKEPFYLVPKKDDMFSKKYNFDWDTVDITKEVKPVVSGTKSNILDRVYNRLKKYHDLVVIDDGANEVADIIALDENKIILVHAKASSKEEAGLRVGDIQVVASQLTKNMKFFLAESFTTDIYDRLAKRYTEKENKVISSSAIGEKIEESLYHHQIKKECWIVQPGILKKKLKDDKENKIHTLLNMLDSVCIADNIKFRFICSGEV